MRIRSIKPEFFSDRVTARWRLELQMFYVALWCLADDEGRFDWEPRLIQGQLFPYHPDLDAEGLLQELREAGRVVKYQKDGVTFGYIPSFKQHQHPERPKESSRPEPLEELHCPITDVSVTTLRKCNAGEEGRGEERRETSRSLDAAGGGFRLEIQTRSENAAVSAKARGTRAKAKRDGSTPSRHNEVLSLFARLWAEKRGGKYRVVGTRDGKWAKTLLTYPEATDEEIRRRMLVALAEPWFAKNGNFAIFVSKWSNYDGLGWPKQPSSQASAALAAANAEREKALAEFLVGSDG